jgi:antitoxin component YwqK of YwqJK toxin-antitoxin module
MILKMKTHLILIFCLITFFNAFSQETKKEYYENGNIKLEYKELSGKPDGQVKLYYETGELQGDINYSNGMQNGQSIIYYQSGKIMKEMTFIDGSQTDTMKIYYESGQLNEVSIIKNEKKEGYYIQYFENGNLKLKGATKDGHVHGFCEHYTKDGKLEKKGEYYYGEPVGTWMEYDEIGVTQKQYPSKNQPEIPSEVKKVKFQNEVFELEHKNTWKVVPHQNPAVKFVAIPLTAEGAFKENMTVVTQPISKETKKLNQFVSKVNDHIKAKHPSFKILSSTEAKTTYTYQDVVYTITQTLGYSNINFKIRTRYFIVAKNTYQITFTCEEEKFDNYNEEVQDVFESFRLKK